MSQSLVPLTLIDRPSYPIGELIALTDRIKSLPPEQQKAEITKFSAAHTPPHQRLYLGRGDDKSVASKLKDADGHDRIVVQVAPDGSPDDSLPRRCGQGRQPIARDAEVRRFRGTFFEITDCCTPLKTEASRADVPLPDEVVEALSAWWKCGLQ